MQDRTYAFLEHLYDEKIKHKEHRHEFVKQKLFFTIGLFSIGSLKLLNNPADLSFGKLLYFVPAVALAFDIYIFSEDFKVKRIGKFILNKCKNVYSEIEGMWEAWLKDFANRERLALFASAGLTIIALIASFLVLSLPIQHAEISNINQNAEISNINYQWFILNAAIITLVFEASIFQRNRLLHPSRIRFSTFGFVLLTAFALFGVLTVILILSDYQAIKPLRTLAKANNYFVIAVGAFLVASILSILFVYRESRIRLFKNRRNVLFTCNSPEAKQANSVSLIGDFNQWNPTANVLQKDKNGVLSTTVNDLIIGKEYQYLYKLGEDEFVTDVFEERSQLNQFNTYNSVIRVTPPLQEKFFFIVFAILIVVNTIAFLVF
ncbi:hypothetical protein KC799_06045 [candidate division KSB1 bacterium]|nr:hypothetical protein [candidate division KSB1 bacterium]